MAKAERTITIKLVGGKTIKLAVSEAKKLGIPIVGVVDTNNSPKGIDYVIPGNDDAIRAINLYAEGIADAIIEGAPHQVSESDVDGFVELDDKGEVVEKEAKKKAAKKKVAKKKVAAKKVAVKPASTEAKSEEPTSEEPKSEKPKPEESKSEKPKTEEKAAASDEAKKSD